MIPAVAIIPAHNEAPRIAAVVGPLLASGRFTRVVVVDDGSTDATTQAAQAAGAHTITLTPNRGKGGALLAGIQGTTEPVVAFFDADLLGLKPEHVGLLVDPVAAGDAVMVCGLRDYGAKYNALQLAIPPITGERAIRRDILTRVPANFWQGFAVEAGINSAACHAGPVWDVVLVGLTIVPKWNKVGIAQGVTDAAKMARDVLVAMKQAQGTGAIAAAGQAVPATAPAPSSPPPVTMDQSGRITGVDGMLDQIAAALAKQARPMLQNDVLPALQRDRETQREIGAAAGRAAAKAVEGPLWLAAGALALIAVVLLVRSRDQR
jgi:hypothetical protein